MKYPPRGLYVIRGTSDGGLGQGQGATSSPDLAGNTQPPLPVRVYREGPAWAPLVAAVCFVLAFVLVLTVSVASR